MKMIERNQEDQKRTEEVLGLLKKEIQPVLRGERESLDILVEFRHPITGRVTTNFLPVPGVLGERGKRVFEMLRREIEYAPGYEYWAERREADVYHYEELWNVPIKHEGVSLERKEIYEKFRDKEGPERIVWSIRNFQPKSKLQKVRERVRKFLGLEEQFV